MFSDNFGMTPWFGYLHYMSALTLIIYIHIYVCAYVYICICLYKCIYKQIHTHTNKTHKGNLLNGSQVVVQLVQQWLSTNKSSKNTVIAQSITLDVSACLQYMLASKNKKAKEQGFFFHVLYIDCQDKVWYRLNVYLYT